MHNIYAQPAAQGVVGRLKLELARLRAELGDDDRFAERQPPSGVDVKPPPPKSATPRSGTVTRAP